VGSSACTSLESRAGEGDHCRDVDDEFEKLVADGRTSSSGWGCSTTCSFAVHRRHGFWPSTRITTGARRLGWTDDLSHVTSCHGSSPGPMLQVVLLVLGKPHVAGATSRARYCSPSRGGCPPRRRQSSRTRPSTSSAVVTFTSSTFENWCMPMNPRVSFPAAPASVRHEGA